MSTIASITSKRQLTIPKEIFDSFGFESNSKVVLEEVEGGVLLKPTSSLIDSLAGSVSIPKSLKGVPSEVAISKAKKVRFSR